jgi:lysophospholipase L1-like esterase
MNRGIFISSLFLVGAISAACVEEGVEGTDVEEDTSSLTDKAVYLAIGDSIAFGSDPHFFPADIIGGVGLAPENDQPFYSYVDLISEWTDRPHVNSSCHGESTTSYLSTAPQNLNMCQRWRFVNDFDLHAKYSGTQNEFVYSYLATHPNISLVTFGLGANDGVILTRQCQGDLACILPQFPAVLQRAGQNLAVALGTIRSVYGGQLVVVNYYSNNYNDRFVTGSFAALNSVIAKVAPLFGAQVVDIFGAFAAASAPFGGDACAAGLIIFFADGTCDFHPSPAGDELIANTIIAAAGL